MRQKVCESRERGEERRVKVVIDGRPGLRAPPPYSGQGACMCRRLPGLPPSIAVFITSLHFSHSGLRHSFFLMLFSPVCRSFTAPLNHAAKYPVNTKNETYLLPVVNEEMIPFNRLYEPALKILF